MLCKSGIIAFAHMRVNFRNKTLKHFINLAVEGLMLKFCDLQVKHQISDIPASIVSQ